MSASPLEHPLRRLQNCGQDAAYVAAIVRERADQIGEVTVFQVVAAINRRWEVSQETGFSLSDYSVINGFHEVYRLGNHFAAGAAQRPRMLRSNQLHVLVVV